MIELISVHVPKCAGTALASALRRAYGADAVLTDNTETPGHPTSPVNLDPIGYFEGFQRDGYPFLRGKRVVHGHFHIRKYESVAGCLRTTFLRHPVDRLISHYRYWLRHPRRGHPLHHYMLDEHLDVVRFAQLPMLRHFYSRTFFGGVRRETFDFIGAVETMDRDVQRLAIRIGQPLTLTIENRTPGDASEAPDIRQRLEALLADDIQFYREWCGVP